MASGCVPAHASYFITYEYLKKHFGVDNEELNLRATMTIGATTTFFHDFFIAPSDGKSSNGASVNDYCLVLCSYEAKDVAL